MSKPATKRYIHYCPHCGAEAELRQSDADGYWYVTCTFTDCGCRSKSWKTASTAIDVWNSRTEEG